MEMEPFLKEAMEEKMEELVEESLGIGEQMHLVTLVVKIEKELRQALSKLTEHENIIKKQIIDRMSTKAEVDGISREKADKAFVQKMNMIAAERLDSELRTKADLKSTEASLQKKVDWVALNSAVQKIASPVFIELLDISLAKLKDELETKVAKQVRTIINFDPEMIKDIKSLVSLKAELKEIRRNHARENKDTQLKIVKLKNQVETSQKEQLRDQIDVLEKACVREVARLKNTADEIIEKSNAELRSAEHRLRAANETLVADIKKKAHHEVESYKEHLTRAQNKYETSMKERYHRDIQMVKNDMSNCVRRCNEADKSLKNANKVMHDTERKLGKFQENFDKAQRDSVKLVSRLDDCIKRSDGFAEDFGRIHTDLRNIKEKNSKQHQLLESIKSKTENDKSAQRNAMERMDRELSALKGNFEQKNNELERKLTALNTNMKQSQERDSKALEEATRRIEMHAKTQLEKVVHHLNDQESRILKAVNKNKSSIRELKAEFEKEIGQAKTKLKHLQDNADAVRTSASQHAEELHKLQREIKDTEHKVVRKVSKLNDDATKTKDAVKKMGNDVRLIQKEIDDMKASSRRSKFISATSAVVNRKKMKSLEQAHKENASALTKQKSDVDLHTSELKKIKAKQIQSQFLVSSQLEQSREDIKKVKASQIRDKYAISASLTKQQEENASLREQNENLEEELSKQKLASDATRRLLEETTRQHKLALEMQKETMGDTLRKHEAQTNQVLIFELEKQAEDLRTQIEKEHIEIERLEIQLRRAVVSKESDGTHDIPMDVRTSTSAITATNSQQNDVATRVVVAQNSQNTPPVSAFSKSELENELGPLRENIKAHFAESFQSSIEKSAKLWLDLQLEIKLQDQRIRSMSKIHYTNDSMRALLETKNSLLKESQRLMEDMERVATKHDTEASRALFDVSSMSDMLEHIGTSTDKIVKELSKISDFSKEKHKARAKLIVLDAQSSAIISNLENMANEKVPSPGEDPAGWLEREKDQKIPTLSNVDSTMENVPQEQTPLKAEYDVPATETNEKETEEEIKLVDSQLKASSWTDAAAIPRDVATKPAESFLKPKSLSMETLFTAKGKSKKKQNKKANPPVRIVQTKGSKSMGALPRSKTVHPKVNEILNNGLSEPAAVRHHLEGNVEYLQMEVQQLKKLAVQMQEHFSKQYDVLHKAVSENSLGQYTQTSNQNRNFDATTDTLYASSPTSTKRYHGSGKMFNLPHIQ
eukprot:g1415.t1